MLEQLDGKKNRPTHPTHPEASYRFLTSQPPVVSSRTVLKSKLIYFAANFCFCRSSNSSNFCIETLRSSSNFSPELTSELEVASNNFDSCSDSVSNSRRRVRPSHLPPFRRSASRWSTSHPDRSANVPISKITRDSSKDLETSRFLESSGKR